MWSVKVVPTPGLASTASRSASGRGSVRRVTSKVSGTVVWLMGSSWVSPTSGRGCSCRDYLPGTSPGQETSGAACDLEEGRDGVADLGSAAYRAPPRGEVGRDRAFDPGRLVRAAEVLEQHPDRE